MSNGGSNRRTCTTPGRGTCFGAVPASSSRKPLGRVRSASTTTRWRPLVIPTWSTRRSSSSSSARRCGTIPSDTPNTATRSHSLPFTRWIVDSVTPDGSDSRWNSSRSHVSNVAASGCRSATPRSPSRSSRWLDPCPPPVRSSRLIAAPRPTSSRTTSRMSRVVPCRPASTTSRRSSARSRTLPKSFSGTWSARPATSPTAQRLRRARRSANHCGRPRLGRRRISTTSRWSAPSGLVAMRR